MIGLLALPLACVAPEAEPAIEEAEVDWTAPTLTPEYGVANLEEAVRAAALETTVHPVAVTRWLMEIGDELRELGLEECSPTPEPSTDLPGFYAENWFGVCSTDEYDLSGGWLATYKLGEDLATEGQVSLLLSIVGTARGVGPVHMGGIVIGNWMTDGADKHFEYEVAGDFRDAAAPEPLAFGSTLQLTASGGWSPRGGLRATFDGSIAGEQVSVRLDEVAIDAACGPGATGALWLRDPSTGWWKVDMAEDCSGCGPAYFADEEMGEACVGEALAESITSSFNTEWP